MSTPHRRGRRAIVVAVVALVGSSACGDDGPTAGEADSVAGVAAGEVEGVVEGVAVPDGFVVTELAGGFAGPTQLAATPDGDLVLAELNGGEDDGTGRVVRFDPEAPDDREVLVDDLLTPTGVTVDGDRLWIMEQRRLTVGPLTEPDDRTVVLDELPFNGRSEGTLTAVDGGGVLYDTSGRRDGDRLTDGSGTLWYLAGPDAVPEPFATGFKHAYAHAPVGDGRWYVTEISDGTLDGEPPPDELVIATAGDDFAYPRCIGDATPVAELGVDAADCATTPPSLALFPPRATPTSVAVAPWDAATVLVALWVTGEVVAVPAEPAAEPHTGAPFLTGELRPQHLLADGDRLLVVDFDAGRVLAVTAIGDP